MEQQLESAAAGATSSDPRDQRRRIPFVDNDEIGAFQEFIKIEGRPVKMHLHPGYERCGIMQDGLAAILQRIDPAPAIGGFANHDFMAKPDKFTRDPA
jgi:hypothetical protein